MSTPPLCPLQGPFVVPGYLTSSGGWAHQCPACSFLRDDLKGPALAPARLPPPPASHVGST